MRGLTEFRRAELLSQRYNYGDTDDTSARREVT